jgi:hypothetical protein
VKEHIVEVQATPSLGSFVHASAGSAIGLLGPLGSAREESKLEGSKQMEEEVFSILCTISLSAHTAEISQATQAMHGGNTLDIVQSFSYTVTFAQSLQKGHLSSGTSRLALLCRQM